MIIPDCNVCGTCSNSTTAFNTFLSQICIAHPASCRCSATNPSRPAAFFLFNLARASPAVKGTSSYSRMRNNLGSKVDQGQLVTSCWSRLQSRLPSVSSPLLSSGKIYECCGGICCVCKCAGAGCLATSCSRNGRKLEMVPVVPCCSCIIASLIGYRPIDLPCALFSTAELTFKFARLSSVVRYIG